MRPGCGGQLVCFSDQKNLRDHPGRRSVLQKGKLRLEEGKKQRTQGHSMSCSRARPRCQVSSVDPGALSNLLRDLLPKILCNGPRGPLDHFHREQDPCIILPRHPRTKRAQGPLVPAQPCRCVGWNLSHVTLLSLSPSPVKWGFKKQDPGWLP